jgi:hypothetical protein
MYADYHRLYATVGMAKLNLFLRQRTGRGVYERRGEWGTTAALLVLKAAVAGMAAVSTVASAMWPPRHAAHSTYFARLDAEHRTAVGSFEPCDQPRDRFDRVH